MRFRMLGELQVFDGDVAVPIRGAKQRMLLLLLLVRARETVQAERLAEELWGDDPPAGGANALQALVSKLRRALGPLSDALSTGAGGYRIDVEDDEIDARCFEAAATEGREALVAGEATAAADACRRALALWRGPALDGSDNEGVLRREAGRLDELRWAALEDRLDADLQSGRDLELVGELEQLVGEAPLRERLHGFLMLALYRSGRQAEALRAYQHARNVLGEELGLDPGPELQALESAILAQDPALDPVVRPLAPRRRTNVHAALSSFVGRHDDLAALEGLAAEQRLTTVVGPGGAGKTRLAHEVVLRRQLLEDVWMVELAALSDPAAVTDTLRTVLVVPDGPTTAASGGDGASLQPVAEHLQGRATLLLLDNCEHLIAEAARVAEQLLQLCPDLRILATSREALGVPGECLWPIPPMSAADATALFLDRAAAGGFDTTQDVGDAVEELCLRLDGLPLAIELAAARTRAIPVSQLTARLDDRFRLLTGGARTALPRQQTLRAVVEWSYDLLFTDEQRVLDRVTVFAGGCSLEGAEAVCAGGDVDARDIADILARLVDKSLVIADRTGRQVRFLLLQTLLLFGRERLAGSDEAEAVRDRHALHFRGFCQRGLAAFRGERQVPWLVEASREADNLRAALGWAIERGDAQAALDIVGGVGWTWWLTGWGEEGCRWFDAALACPGAVTPASRATALMWAAAVRATNGVDLDTAVDLSEDALARWAEIGDDVGFAEACVLGAGVHLTTGDHERALDLFDQAHATFAGRPDPWSRAVGASAAGRAALLRGEAEVAARMNLEAAAAFEECGATWALVNVNGDVAFSAELRGDIPTAIDRTQRALDAARALELRPFQAQLLARLGNLRLCLGELDEASTLHLEAVALADEVGSKPSLTVALNGRAMGLRALDRLEEAGEAADGALQVARATGLPLSQLLALVNLGFVAERQGRRADAVRFQEEALAIARALGENRVLALVVEGLAGVALLDGDGEAAARLLGGGQRLRTVSGGAPAGPASDVERITDGGVALVGRAAFDAAHAAGGEMALEELLLPS